MGGVSADSLSQALALCCGSSHSLAEHFAGTVVAAPCSGQQGATRSSLPGNSQCKRGSWGTGLVQCHSMVLLPSLTEACQAHAPEWGEQARLLPLPTPADRCNLEQSLGCSTISPTETWEFLLATTQPTGLLQPQFSCSPG